jgi:hypothetical protein
MHRLVKCTTLGTATVEPRHHVNTDSRRCWMVMYSAQWVYTSQEAVRNRLQQLAICPEVHTHADSSLCSSCYARPQTDTFACPCKQLHPRRPKYHRRQLTTAVLSNVYFTPKMRGNVSTLFSASMHVVIPNLERSSM